MTDELVKRLLDLADCDTRAGEPLGRCMREAADHMKTLQAQTLRLSGMVYDLNKEVAISDALLISEAEVSLERLARAEAAEAERDRLRDALEHIAQWSEAYPTEVFPEPDFAQAASALASSGMSIDAVSASNMRHATKGVGKIARAALKGESHE